MIFSTRIIHEYATALTMFTQSRRLVPEHRNFLTFAAFILFYIYAASALADDPDQVPAEVVDSWKPRWDQTVERLIDGVVQQYRAKLLSNLTPEKSSIVVEDMRVLFRARIGWEAMGQQTVKNALQTNCGTELLDKVAPYHGSESKGEGFPENLKSEYRDCAVDVLLQVDTSPAYALLGVGKKELPELLRRHGLRTTD